MKADKILIVEDDPLWQEFLQEPLQDEYALTVVSTRAEAEQALNAAKAAGEPFAVVTVDIGLERAPPSIEPPPSTDGAPSTDGPPSSNGGASMDGETILALVSQHHRRTKCIVVTGHEGVGKSRLRNYFKEFDVFDYVGKDDFDLIEFKKIVDQAFYFHGYRLLAELGRGGMSTVYKALDPQNGNRVVAIKVLHQDPRLSPDEVTQRLARFDQEVETIRKLDHPNIVALYDYRADTEASEDQVFFVMEYLNGPTLEAVLADGQNLPQAQVVEIGLQLCDALAYAHARQVVHRDVKPSNIILTAEGQVKVTDFGIAKVMDTGSSLTRTEEIVGTLDYMPPEQILYAKGVDHRVDIYATGVVLYELLSGKKPYDDPLIKLKGAPVPLGEVTAGVPDSLAAVVMHALAPEPDERYQTAHDMIRALRAC